MNAEIKEVTKQQDLIEVKLDLQFKVREEDRKTLATRSDVAVLCITFAVNTKYGEKMPQSDSMIWANIQDDLIDKPKSLRLSKNDFDWLYRMVTQCEYPAGYSSWRRTICDYLEELKIKTGKKEETS